MDNYYHLHLLVETPAANLSRGMRQLNGAFTQRLNRRHGRVGQVFKGRYQAIVVEREAHLLELARYVVPNPVRAGPRDGAARWRWSSCRATAGLSPARPFEHVAWLLGRFDADGERARAAYRRFVAGDRRAARPAPSGASDARGTPGGMAGAGRVDGPGAAGARLYDERHRRGRRPALFVRFEDHQGVGRGAPFTIQELTLVVRPKAGQTSMPCAASIGSRGGDEPLRRIEEQGQ